MRPVLRSMWLAAAVAAVACADVASPKGPGPVSLRLTLPPDGGEAVLVAISGGPVDSVTAAGLDALWLKTGVDEYALLLRGALRDVADVRLWVPDPEYALTYVAVVTQAIGHDYQRRDPAGYGVTVR